MHMQQVANVAIPLSAVFDDVEVLELIDYDEFEDEDDDKKRSLYDENEGMHDRSLEIPFPRNQADVVDSLERLASI